MQVAGIPPKMLVEAHGTFATATCTVCRRDYKGEELHVSALNNIFMFPFLFSVIRKSKEVSCLLLNLMGLIEQADVMKGNIPKCPTCKGVIKPDIVFFGEELPNNFFMYLTDFPMADLLIIMGTSLEVS